MVGKWQSQNLKNSDFKIRLGMSAQPGGHRGVMRQTGFKSWPHISMLCDSGLSP